MQFTSANKNAQLYAQTNQRLWSANIPKTKNFATVSANLSMLNKDNDFCNKLSQIRCGTLTGNTKFDVERLCTGSLIENYSMIVEITQTPLSAAPIINVVLRCYEQRCNYESESERGNSESTTGRCNANAAGGNSRGESKAKRMGIRNSRNAH